MNEWIPVAGWSLSVGLALVVLFRLRDRPSMKKWRSHV
jgi:hypothetical protein